MFTINALWSCEWPIRMIILDILQNVSEVYKNIQLMSKLPKKAMFAFTLNPLNVGYVDEAIKVLKSLVEHLVSLT